MKKLIAITIGDIEGIGIRILIKEWSKNKIKNFVIICNHNIYKKSILDNKNNINLIKKDDQIINYDTKKINILNIKTKNKHTNAMDSLNKAYEMVNGNYFIGIITLPINKKNINKYVNKNFIDQTTFFSNLEKNDKTNMIFLYNKKFFIPLTIHVELKNVYKYFEKKNYIFNKILSLKKTISTDFNINNPKMIISGINPHAGEEGLISNDEKKYLIPIINKLKKNKKINIDGPVSGDGMINKLNLNKYDIFLFPYHDQALIPFKIISNFQGINFTSNLNIIRLSPSHGTAKDLIGSKHVKTGGIINCFKIIRKIYKNRNSR